MNEVKFQLTYSAFKQIKRFFKILTWDAKIVVKYQILTAYVLVSIAYILILRFVPFPELENILIFLLFSDPSFMGILFIAGLVYFERNQRVHLVIGVMPIRPSVYTWSKSIILTSVSLLSACIIQLFTNGINIQWGWFLGSILLSSILYTLIGLWIVSYAKSLNHYMLFALALNIIILLPFFQINDVFTFLGFYGWPSYAGILLLECAYTYTITWELALYTIGYSLIWIGVVSFFVNQRYKEIATLEATK